MTSRAIVLLVAALVGMAVLWSYSLVRKRWGAELERLDVDELGLELMTGCCAFIVFTSPACRPCKSALKVVREAAEDAPSLTEVTTVDAIERDDLTLRYDVRTIPTVFLITASGHVIGRWRGVPDRADVRARLATV